MQLHLLSLLLPIVSFVFAASLAPTTTSADNAYPIVLVHGFSGWGRDELLGFKYWGGLQGDFQEELEGLGYTVYTAVVGPFSSNWDRACELYAQIKGGRVDYGAKHSAKFGHLQYGRNFTGLYPEWGELNSDGSTNKVHLIGHSMGGQTIRMLTQLLEKGTTGAPVQEAASSHLLFEGGHTWVHSITTVSTPNQGTLHCGQYVRLPRHRRDAAVVAGWLMTLEYAVSGAGRGLDRAGAPGRWRALAQPRGRQRVAHPGPVRGRPAGRSPLRQGVRQRLHDPQDVRARSTLQT